MKKIFLDLGRQPLANDFKLKGENEFYNLKIEFDQKTKLISKLISDFFPCILL